MRTGVTAALGMLLLVQALILPAFSDGTAPSAPSRADLKVPSGLLSGITSERMAGFISNLTSFGTRYFYSSKIAEAAGYIHSVLSSFGLNVTRQDFLYNGYAASNVIATLGGSNASAPVYVLGAHYDSLNNSASSMNPEAPAPGADDDASGVAAVLCAAEALSRTQPQSTILFAAFTGEEVGRVGSREFVSRLQFSGVNIGAALCLDMIGYNHHYPKVDVVSNTNSLWLSDLSCEVSHANWLGLMTEQVVTSDNPYNWSDQVSFWDAGIPSIYYIEDENPTSDSAHFEANPYYHSGDDTPDRLNMTLCAKVAKLGAATLAALAGVELPDFAIVLNGNIPTVYDGENIPFNISIGNFGAFATAVDVSLMVDGRIAGNASIAPDGNDAAVVSWKATAGRHDISVVVDPADRYLESNEGNNRVDLSLNVSGLPDLYIADFYSTDDDPPPRGIIHLVAQIANAGCSTATGRLMIGPGAGPTLFDAPVTVMPGMFVLRTVNATVNDSATEFRAGITDVYLDSNTTNNALCITVTPHAFDTGNVYFRVTPDVCNAFEEVRAELVPKSNIPERLDWLVDFGDGSVIGWLESNSVNHLYSAPGDYIVRARARDCTGAVMDLLPLTLRVRNTLPVPLIGASASGGVINGSVSFSAALSYDADGMILQYMWDFGDGQSGLGPEVKHQFATPRNYVIRLSVFDNDGGSNLTTYLFEVVNPAPVCILRAAQRSLIAGENASLDGSLSFDPDGAVVSCRWDFGDGTYGTGALVTHNYPSAGKYRVVLNATDTGGAHASGIVTLTVYPVPGKPPLFTQPGNAWMMPLLVCILLIIVLALIAGSRGPKENDDEE